MGRIIIGITDEGKACYVRFDAFTMVTTKNSVFWDVTLLSSMGRLIIGIFDERNSCQMHLRGNRRTMTKMLFQENLFPAHSVIFSLRTRENRNLFTPKMEAKWSSETSAVTRATLCCHIPEDTVLLTEWLFYIADFLSGNI
jgi:hypothetical protein